MNESSLTTQRDRTGMLCVALAAMLFASKGIFGKLLYQRGVGFEVLVTVRALFAMPLFAWLALRRSGPTTGAAPRIRARAFFAAMLAGVVCYYVGALVDFWALMLIDASVERVLLFSYPAMVVALGASIERRAPEARVVWAMLLTYVGIFFAMGGIDLAELRANLFGAGLVLIAALTTAVYFLIGARYTRELGSTRFAAIAMISAAVLLAIHFAAFRSFDEVRALDGPEWLLLAVLGIACMFVPGLLQAEGMRRVGASRAAIGSTIGPPTTIVLAALFFHERLNLWQVLGSAMIVGSVLVLSVTKSRAA
ncbi:MAG TPA: DMT family transporter [Steroidobacteraceae bacterium]|nr:DMT family transporter [Steroidobacteraceae bacterium]